MSGRSAKNKARARKNKIILAALVLLAAAISLAAFALLQPEAEGADETFPARSSAPLVLTWELAGAAGDYDTIPPMGPLTVVSPTWFHLEDAAGGIENLADTAYLDWAGRQGYQVWALFSNSFDPVLTAQFLSDQAAQERAVQTLLDLAAAYDLDGINVDFENFHSDHSAAFTSFVGNLKEAFNEVDPDFVISVDVTMISNAEYWSLNYDRAALAAVADYIVLMAYDEHWQASPRAGSVASLPWVESGLVRVLEHVPAEQLILGVPFYTRLFKVDDSQEPPLVFGSWSYGMERAENIADEKGAQFTYDQEAGQTVASYREEGYLYIMWLEDEHSMTKRLELLERYNLAGVAAWRRGLERAEIWDLFSLYFNSSFNH